MNLGFVIVLAIHLQRRAQVRGAVGPDQLAVFHGNTALEPLAVDARNDLHGHGIQHLIANDHALHVLGQRTGPDHLGGMGCQALLLARAQRAGQIDDGVALHFHALALQLVQYLQRQRARACTKLPDLTRAGALHGFGHLRRYQLAEYGRDLRRRHKVAAGIGQRTEFGSVVRVVAQPRRIQRQRHETVKANPSASLGNGLVNVRVQGTR